MRKPGLHDLVGVQVEMSRRYAWTPKRSLAVVDDLHQIGVITYPRTQSTGVDLHSLQQAREAVALLRAAGHEIHPESSVDALLVIEPDQPGVTFYDIPGIIPIGDLSTSKKNVEEEDRRKAYDEIVAQFIHAVSPAA